jgi:Ca2+-binding RTX toxin-like protein
MVMLFRSLGGNDTIDCDPRFDSLGSIFVPVSVEAGEGADLVIGTRSSDVIDLGSGNDSVYAGDGLDKVLADNWNPSHLRTFFQNPSLSRLRIQ